MSPGTKKTHRERKREAGERRVWGEERENSKQWIQSRTCVNEGSNSISAPPVLGTTRPMHQIIRVMLLGLVLAGMAPKLLNTIREERKKETSQSLHFIAPYRKVSMGLARKYRISILTLHAIHLFWFPMPCSLLTSLRALPRVALVVPNKLPQT